MQGERISLILNLPPISTFKCHTCSNLYAGTRVFGVRFFILTAWKLCVCVCVCVWGKCAIVSLWYTFDWNKIMRFEKCVFFSIRTFFIIHLLSRVRVLKAPAIESSSEFYDACVSYISLFFKKESKTIKWQGFRV